jgi:hypothetical protein
MAFALADTVPLALTPGQVVSKQHELAVTVLVTEKVVGNAGATPAQFVLKL